MVFRVGVFSSWVVGPVVWGLLGYLGWGSLYKHKKITLGKNVATPLGRDSIQLIVELGWRSRRCIMELKK